MHVAALFWQGLGTTGIAEGIRSRREAARAEAAREAAQVKAAREAAQVKAARGTTARGMSGRVERSAPARASRSRLLHSMRHLREEILAAQERDQARAPGGAGGGAAAAREVEAWLERLWSAVHAQGREAAGAAQAAKERRDGVIYLLSQDPAVRAFEVSPGAGVRLHPVVVRVDRNGRYSSQRPCGFQGGQGAGYLVEEDRPLLANLLCACSRQWTLEFSSPVPLQATRAPAVIEQAIATGRCHWRTKDEPPLTWGAARGARIAWVMDGEGGQVPSLEGLEEPTVVLSTRPLLYLDADRRECGPLQLDLEAGLAAALLSAPRVAPESVGTIRARIARHLPTHDVPLPQVLEIETSAARVKPVPHLRLYQMQVGPLPGAYYRASDLDFLEPRARLSFDYDGARVGAFDTRDTISLVETGKVRRISRDVKAEGKALRRLERLEMVPLHDVDDEPEEDNGAGDFLFDLDEDDLQGALVRFSVEEVPRLRAQGWRVEMDADYPYRVVEGEVAWYADVEEHTGNDWFGLELGIEIDGERSSLLPILLEILRKAPGQLSLEALARIPENQALMVRLPDGRLLPLPIQRARAILGTLTELYMTEDLDPGGRMVFSTRHAPRLAEIEEAMGAGALRWSGGEALRELGRKLREFHGVREVGVPAGFAGTLRPYQRRGLDWIQFLREHDLAGILADDMGLGKTVQVLAHLLVEKESGRMDRPCLIVAPTSLMPNWRREAERFAPVLRVLTLQGTQRKQRFGELAGHDVVLTTYPLLSRDEAVLRAQDFHYLVLDEAQFIKNPKTKAASIARDLSARHRLCLTGTPMENHLGELWSLFHTLMPGLLGDEKRFRKLFRDPIEKQGSGEMRARLAARIRPFLLRRNKEEVAPELPPKTEIVQTIELHQAQRDLYESIRLAMHERVRAEVSRRGLARSSIVILDALLKLRQVCCDPRLLKIKEARGVTTSAKLDALMDMLAGLTAEGRRILLFSQFTSMLALIEPELRARSIPFVRLTGETRDRDTPVRLFQSGEVPLFLISLKAGGTGLNLPAADTVIHYDPWWNPAVENQATDRAHRIGQDKAVFVYRLIVSGSVEEKIQALQARKRDLAAGIFGADSKGQTPLTSEDLEFLFRPLGAER